MILLTTKDNTRYLLTDEGAVLDRSDGPAGWNYSGRWIILGVLTRANSSRIVPLVAAVSTPSLIGHGYVVDSDHGTRRVWMSPDGRSVSRLERIYGTYVMHNDGRSFTDDPETGPMVITDQMRLPIA